MENSNGFRGSGPGTRWRTKYTFLIKVHSITPYLVRTLEGLRVTDTNEKTKPKPKSMGGAFLLSFYPPNSTGSLLKSKERGSTSNLVGGRTEQTPIISNYLFYFEFCIAV